MKKLYSVVLISLAFLMVGCGEIFAPVPGGHMTMRALVLDAQSTPLSNMRVVFGYDTLYTGANGVAEYATICLTLGDYTTRVVVDDANGIYAKDSVDVTILKTDFQPSKQYSLGVAKKETTLKLTKIKI